MACTRARSFATRWQIRPLITCTPGDLSESARKIQLVPVPEFVSFVESSRVEDLKRMNGLVWDGVLQQILKESGESPARMAYDRIDGIAKKLVKVQDSHSRHQIVSVLAATAIGTRSIESEQNVQELLSRFLELGAPFGLFMKKANELAQFLAEFHSWQLAWRTIQIASDMYANRLDKGIKIVADRPLRRLHFRTREQILKRISFIRFQNAEMCGAAREAIKQMIVMTEEDGNFVGDFAFIVLARMCSDGSNWGQQTPPHAVYDFLDWAVKGKGWKITEEAYGSLILHSLRGNDIKLAKQLFSDCNYNFGRRSTRQIFAALAALDQIDLVERVLDNLKQDQTPTVGKNNSYLREICLLRWLGNSSKLSTEAKLNFLEAISEDEQMLWSPVTLRFALSFYVKLGRPSDVIRYFQLLKGHADCDSVLRFATDPTVRLNPIFLEVQESFNHVLYCVAKYGGLKELLNLYEVDRSKYWFSLKQETCTAIISRLAYTHPVQGSKVLDDYESGGKVGDVVMYTAFIDALMSAGKLEQAIELLHRMKSKGVQPNTNTFNTVVSGLCKVGNIKAGVRFLDVMDSVRCPPDRTTYHILMNAYLKRSRWEEAHKMVARMEARGITWNVVTFNIWINAHTRRDGGSLQEADRLFAAMQSHPFYFRPSSGTYDIRLSNFVMKKEWDNVENSLKLIETGVYTCSHHEKIKSYRTAIIGLCKAGLLDRANALYETISTSSSGSDLCTIRTALIRCAAVKDMMDMAKGYYADHIRSEIFGNDGINGAMLFAYRTRKDYNGAVDFANDIIPGAGTGVATLATVRGWGPLFDERSIRANSGGKSNVGIDHNKFDPSPSPRANFNGRWTGAVVLGRACSYELMLIHAFSGNLSLMESVHAQMLRLESWGFSNSSEAKSKNSKYFMNEANVLIQCYGRLGLGQKALSIWEEIWKSPVTPAKSTYRARGPSSLSSQGLSEIYGVDRITVCNVIDALKFARMFQEADTVWKAVNDSGFPMDLNNYISYQESLAERNDWDGCLEFLEQKVLRGNHGLELDAKVFATIYAMPTSELYRPKIWNLMMQHCPQFESELRRRLSQFLHNE